MPQQRLFRRGDVGPAVADIRDRFVRMGALPAAPDEASAGVFDAALDAAVRQFQQNQGLLVDGVVDAQTFRRLEESRWKLGDRVLSYNVSHPMSGEDVATLQQRLLDMGFNPVRVDGHYGPRTEAAVRSFQRNIGVLVDGTCGPATFDALRRLNRTVVGGTPGALREHEAIRRSGPALAGKVVVIDPGHGGVDAGVVAHGTREAELVEDIAARIEGRLSALGVQALLTRGPGSGAELDDAARADFANRTGADLVVSLHVDAAASESCRGVATYFYGGDRQGAWSATGHRLALLLQEELTARTDLLDCRTHAKTWELLRATRMPTVKVEVGYLTNPGDAARLGQPAFRDTVAEAVVAAIGKLYQDDDTATFLAVSVPQ